MSMLKLLIIPLVLALSACASNSLPVSRDYDLTADFSRLHRFAWAPDSPPSSGNPVLDSDTLLHQRLRDNINGALQFKGFQTAADGAADFWVAYKLTSTRQHDVIVRNNGYYGSFGYGFGWGGYYGAFPMGGYGGQETLVRDYEQRTLVLDILDPATRKLLWRATAPDDSEDYASPMDRSRYIARLIQTLLDGFPPLPPGH